MDLFSALLFALLTVPERPRMAVETSAREQLVVQEVYGGTASYYSRAGCVGCSKNMIMANGEPLDDSRLTVAFNKAKLNTYVIIENSKTGETVKAKVTDRGGFEKLNRIIDLSLATKLAINCTDLCQVKVTKVE